MSELVTRKRDISSLEVEITKEKILGSDARRFQTYRWIGNDTSKGTIIICHGQSEHAFVYDTVAKNFVKEGYAVYALDHIGHGKTVKDKKKLGFVQGVDISFLTEEQQQWVVLVLQEQMMIVSTTQSGKLKEFGKQGELTLPMVKLILSEPKVKERKVTIQADKLNQYFPSHYNRREIEEVIYQLLEEWKSRA